MSLALRLIACLAAAAVPLVPAAPVFADDVKPAAAKLEAPKLAEGKAIDLVLCLDVSSSNFPRFDRNPNTGGTVADDTRLIPAIQTVYHDRDHPSHLALMVMPPNSPARSARRRARPRPIPGCRSSARAMG